MKFALINGIRQVAVPDTSGVCPGCNQAVIPKCGEKKVWHWAHKSSRKCDPWWESETEWHRAWKSRFPEPWQEVVHRAEDGETHIADVKTAHGWTIEFQHSYIKPDERRARNAYYQKLIWIVDGTRRKNDAKQFATAYRSGVPIGRNAMVRRADLRLCTLLQEWACEHPVFLDFGDGRLLWLVLHNPQAGCAYVAPFSTADFLAIHLGVAAEHAVSWDQFFVDPFQLGGRSIEAQRPQAQDAAPTAASRQHRPVFSRRVKRL